MLGNDGIVGLTSTDEIYFPFEKSMTRLCEFLGAKPVANLLRPLYKAEQTASDLEVNDSTRLQHVEQHNTINGIAEQPLSPNSDSSVSASGGYFPNNAITRDIVRQTEERDKLQATGSSWALPKLFRPFNAASRSGFPSTAASGDFMAANLPFRLRLDFLFYRCRLLVLEESFQMLNTIRKLENETKHSVLLVEGLRALTSNQAGAIIKDVGSAIAECRSKQLKRLEIEFRLIQFELHRVLRSLDMISDVRIQASANIAIRLCQEYPNTAGIFLTDCLSVRCTDEQRRSSWKVDLYKKEANEFWKLWAGHEVGALKHCQFGHPYSAYTFRDCPECGRRDLPKSVNYGQFLDEKAFLARMRDRNSATSPTTTEELRSPASFLDETAREKCNKAISPIEKEDSGSPVSHWGVVSAEDSTQANSPKTNGLAVSF